MSAYNFAGALVLAASVAASGCGGSLRELKQLASRQHNCPTDRIHAYFSEARRAMLDVCGTTREYQYSAVFAYNQQLFPPQEWKETGGSNFFGESWLDDKLLHDSWGASASDLWVVGTEGAIFRFDGSRWRALSCDADPPHHFGVWGADASAVWIVGTEGVYRWNGTALAHEAPPTGASLVGVHGTSRRDVWAVGRKGLIVHWDGSEWKRVESGVSRDLYRVWAAGPNIAWAVGDVGTMVKWNGKQWRRDSLGTVSPLLTVWASSGDDAWVGTLTGQLFRWNGQQWTEVRLHSVEDMKEGPSNISRILGFGHNDVWVLGSFVDHFNGKSWRRLEWGDLPIGSRGAWAPSWVSSSGHLYTIVEWGTTETEYHNNYQKVAKQGGYAYWDGTRWTRQPWRIWPCNRPRGKEEPKPVPMRPSQPGY